MKAYTFFLNQGKSLPPSNRNKSIAPDVVNQTFSATVGSITINPHFCDWCHKQYASKAKLMQHQRKKHPEKVQNMSVVKPRSNASNSGSSSPNLYRMSTSMCDDKNASSNSPIDASSLSLIKSEIGSTDRIVQLEIDSFKNNKIDNFLSSSSPMSQTFMDNFAITNDFSKNGDAFLNGTELHSNQAQYTIDSSDAAFDDLLNINLPEVTNRNLDLISNPTTTASSYSNNIITILGKCMNRS